jgi:hypothetical protein
VLGVVPAARAELTQGGKLVVSFDGSLAPKALPRSQPAPVALRVAGDFRATRGAPLPQLQMISIAFNSNAGRLYDSGLSTCRVESIQPATAAGARRVCPRAIVGSGHLVLRSHLEGQRPFAVKAGLLVFNGPRRHGHEQILAQAYTSDPPGAFVLTFKLTRRGGRFGTVISTALPREVRPWAYLTHFDMTLHRRYRYRGEGRSFLSAACAAPAGFPGAVFPLARATYGFDNGQQLRVTTVRSCRVAGSFKRAAVI